MVWRRAGAAASKQQEEPEEVKVEEQPMEGQEEGSKKRSRPWERFDEDGNKIKPKKVPGAKNKRARKLVQPRNALQCLNELAKGYEFECIQEGGGGKEFGMSVTVNDNTFTGYGLSKQIAKMTAAEAALASFVKAPVPKKEKGEEGENVEQEEDKTPWAVIASFAMYKLFSDWKDGNYGPRNTPSITSNKSFDLRDYLATKGHKNQSASDPSVNNRPAKKVPDNAAEMNPIQLLHQMRPGTVFTTDKTMLEGNKPHFTVSAEIEGQQFTGEASLVKKAKLQLALNANQELFGVKSTFEIPA